MQPLAPGPGASWRVERAAVLPCVRASVRGTSGGRTDGGHAAVTHPPPGVCFGRAPAPLGWPDPRPPPARVSSAGFTPALALPRPNQTQPGWGARGGGDRAWQGSGRDGAAGCSRAGGRDTGRMRMREEGDGEVPGGGGWLRDGRWRDARRWHNGGRGTAMAVAQPRGRYGGDGDHGTAVAMAQPCRVPRGAAVLLCPPRSQRLGSGWKMSGHRHRQWRRPAARRGGGRRGAGTAGSR